MQGSLTVMQSTALLRSNSSYAGSPRLDRDTVVPAVNGGGLCGGDRDTTAAHPGHGFAREAKATLPVLTSILADADTAAREICIQICRAVAATDKSLSEAYRV